MKNSNLLKRPEMYIFILSIAVTLGIIIFVSVKGFNRSMDTSKDNSSLKEEQTTVVAQDKGNASIKVKAVGNCYFDSSIVNSLRTLDGNYDFSTPFENISSEIMDADIASVNICTPVSNSSEAAVSTVPPKSAVGLSEAGFNLFTCATKPLISSGKDYIASTAKAISNLSDAKRIGINLTEDEAKQITVIRKNGISVALLNYTDSFGDSALGSDDRYMLNVYDEKQATKDIKNAKKIAEAVIVYINWDMSYTSELDSTQEKRVKALCKAGADVIIGSGIGTVQPVKLIEDKDSKHKTLVYYSLGNFLSGTADTDSLTGLTAEFTIVRKDGRVQIENASAVPMITHYDKNITNYKIYKLSDYTDKLASEHFVSTSDKFTPSELMEKMKKAAGDYIK